uniref:Uncharacterized protein n=1 Tax=Clostridium botulinum TaxID=1491 RepID=A0A126JI70_CLOBO|nr:hypothetical protein [Clostridium botulinum]
MDNIIKFYVLFVKFKIASNPLYINALKYFFIFDKLYVENINCMFILLIVRTNYKLLDIKLTIQNLL